jgi:hypothetical protein
MRARWAGIGGEKVGEGGSHRFFQGGTGGQEIVVIFWLFVVDPQDIGIMKHGDGFSGLIGSGRVGEPQVSESGVTGVARCARTFYG